MSATETLQILTITDSAAAKVSELIKQESSEEPLFLRVAVRPGGCSGFSYDMYFDSETDEDDVKQSASFDVQVVVDAASAQMLQGATLDYNDGLQSTGFHIDNPNASRTCGCGNSFS